MSLDHPAACPKSPRCVTLVDARNHGTGGCRQILTVRIKSDGNERGSRFLDLAVEQELAGRHEAEIFVLRRQNRCVMKGRYRIRGGDDPLLLEAHVEFVEGLMIFAIDL